MMTGKVINQFEDIVTIQIDQCYEFSNQEKVKLDTVKTNFIDELRGLYWVLHQYIIDNNIQYKISDVWFNPGDIPNIALKKLYTLTRFKAGFTEVNFDADGMQIITARSTSAAKISQREFSDLYQKTFEYLSGFMTQLQLDGYLKQYQSAREKLGKFF